MRPRSAFTLIELLVVIAVLAVLAALATAIQMRTSNPDRAANVAFTVESWLLTAKQRARREGRPVGLRLFVGATGGVSTLQMIEEPKDFEVSTQFILSGTPLRMPSGFVIDVALAEKWGSKLMPADAMPGAPPACDVVFGPSGQLLGQAGWVVLWVRAKFTSGKLPEVENNADQKLVGVSAMTGTVRVVPVNTTSDAGYRNYTPFHHLRHP
jgi:prepilin-type N-terminal cleavage/methylation domain-containing protein